MALSNLTVSNSINSIDEVCGFTVMFDDGTTCHRIVSTEDREVSPGVWQYRWVLHSKRADAAYGQEIVFRAGDWCGSYATAHAQGIQVWRDVMFVLGADPGVWVQRR